MLEVRFFLFVFFLTTFAYGNHPLSENSVLDLPKNTELVMKGPWIVPRIDGRTEIKSHITTLTIDFVSDSEEVKRSRDKYSSVIEKLSDLKYFKSLRRVQCFLDFNQELGKDFYIPTGTSFLLSTPLNYGTPSEKFTKDGPVVRLDNYADKSLSINFKGKRARRLYCSFQANEDQRYNAEFLDDLKIKHLEWLLLTFFELKY